jgi:hypothetical protein
MRQGRFIMDLLLLWVSSIYVSAGIYECVWPTTSKIDLTLFNIRYEIDINFDFVQNREQAPSFIQLGLNAVTI